MTKQLTLQDYLGIASRRKWLLILPPVIFAIIAFSVSFFLNPRYTSQTLVLVEGQKVSDNLVKPAVAEDLNQRLSTMKEQILSRSRLEPIMQKFGLYKDEAKKVPMEDLIDEMRTKIVVTPIHGANDSTPGFYISFTADNPKLAQDVCAEITSLFMEQNLKLREDRAVGTTDFLTSQLAESKRSLDEQDAKLAAFQRKYIGQLPGQEQLNMSMLTTLKTQLDGVTQALSRAQQDKLYTESLLAQETAAVQPSRTGADAPPVSQLEEQIGKLKENLTFLEARYTPEYPDVIKTKQMIAELEKKVKANNSEVKPPPTIAQEPSTVAQVHSPAAQRLRDNLHLLDETIREKSAEQTKLQQAIKEYERRVQLSPAVEEQYKALTRDYQSAQAFYDDILKKKSMSEMSTDLERRQQGEQFRIVDPANLPEKPSFPKKEMFAGGGFLLGLALGGGLAFALEMMVQTIRSEADIEGFLKLPLLVSVPEIVTLKPSGSRFAKRQWPGRKQETAEIPGEIFEQEAVVEER